ncbi:MAG: ThuA domain-containing protein [Clostridia bacterium]|nr:ThuA domain-containing protein [Clostridia bacterium]
MIRVTVWNEFYHEKTEESVRAVYPEGIHTVIAEFLGRQEDITVRTATLDQPECGLPPEVLAQTDVLIWWGHARHWEVPEEVARRVQEAVLCGMGFIALHSAHHSKPFRYLMGTTCNLSWREDGDMERVWVVAPDHPIAQGIDRYFDLPHEETYAEAFDIPEPDKLVFIGWYEGGEVFRSGCCWRRGRGKIFYFQPGHETFPIYRDSRVQRVITNAVRWAEPETRVPEVPCPNVQKPVLKFDEQ